MTKPAKHHLPDANCILIDDTGQEMEAHYDADTDRWSIALPCGQVADGIRPWSIHDRIDNRGWRLCS